MSVVAAEFVDKAHFPALRDQFSAPIAVAQNRARRQKQKTSRFGVVARLGLSDPATIRPKTQMFD